MKRILLLAATLGLSVPALAQTTVVLTPEEETVIREYVVTHTPEPVMLPGDIALEVGTVLPETIELYPIEAPEFTPEYRYVVVDGRTLLVEPEAREVIYIIE